MLSINFLFLSFFLSFYFFFQSETQNSFEKDFNSIVLKSLELKNGFQDNVNKNEDENEIENEKSDAIQENVDLKRQIVIFEQQLEEKNQTIRLLQQQMVRNLM